MTTNYGRIILNDGNQTDELLINHLFKCYSIINSNSFNSFSNNNEIESQYLKHLEYFKATENWLQLVVFNFQPTKFTLEARNKLYELCRHGKEVISAKINMLTLVKITTRDLVNANLNNSNINNNGSGYSFVDETFKYSRGKRKLEDAAFLDDDDDSSSASSSSSSTIGEDSLLSEGGESFCDKCKKPLIPTKSIQNASVRSSTCVECLTISNIRSSSKSSSSYSSKIPSPLLSSSSPIFVKPPQPRSVKPPPTPATPVLLPPQLQLSSSSPIQTSPIYGTKVGKNFPQEISNILIDWIEKHQSNPFPNAEEKRQLAQLTGLTIRQICDWFINARRRRMKINSESKFEIKQKED